MIIGAKDGTVLYTVRKDKDFGANLKTGDLKGSSLATLWEKVVDIRKPATMDFAIYPTTGEPEAFMGVPVLDERGYLRGVLAIKFGPEKINAIFGSTQAMGETTEAYLVGEDLLMRSNSRFEKQSTILRKRVDTSASNAALQGKSGTGIVKGYRGETVLSSYGEVGLKKIDELGAEFNWAAIAEVDIGEAFGPVHSLRLRIVLIAVCIVAAVAAVAFLLSKGISRPITSMAEKAGQIAEGDLTVDMPVLKRADEIGALGEAFRLMVGNLRAQITRVLDGVKVLSAAAAEISSTVSQVATSTTQTSSAVTETMTTVEQVRQAAQIARDRAKNVAQTAQEAFEISTSGKKATEDTIQGISLIKDQMGLIGETVVRLSDQSRAIEEIISAVKDLADQSNLLAVNASIEAARAGEQGRGFAVVAHEIKSLADQSKAATEQVRSILEDTRKWVSAVVMAAEQGGKAVQAGVNQSVVAGQAIEKLSNSVGASAQAASVIEATSEQQSVGVRQVSDAMTSINQAMRQILDGTSRLEAAAGRLDSLDADLRESIRHYKT
jgi:methyl-accepting chemotaxis protein